LSDAEIDSLDQCLLDRIDRLVATALKISSNAMFFPFHAQCYQRIGCGGIVSEPAVTTVFPPKGVVQKPFDVVPLRPVFHRWQLD